MKLAFKLTGVPAMSPHERKVAEERFGDLLAEVFGSEDGVWKRYEAFQAALSAGQQDSTGSGEVHRDINRWKDAAIVAAKLALGIHSNDASAVFEIARVSNRR